MGAFIEVRASRLFAVESRVSIWHCNRHWVGSVSAYLRALVFLLLRFRRRTRFFLHLALILASLTVESLVFCKGRNAAWVRTLFAVDEVAG